MYIYVHKCRYAHNMFVCTCMYVVCTMSPLCFFIFILSTPKLVTPHFPQWTETTFIVTSHTENIETKISAYFITHYNDIATILQFHCVHFLNIYQNSRISSAVKVGQTVSTLKLTKLLNLQNLQRGVHVSDTGS